MTCVIGGPSWSGLNTSWNEMPDTGISLSVSSPFGPLPRTVGGWPVPEVAVTPLVPFVAGTLGGGPLAGAEGELTPEEPDERGGDLERSLRSLDHCTTVRFGYS
uniref:Uncharacterized protein n=1 Tax=Anopheles atroparvus TaxID=41427 RepID=A0A182IX53_ANOAO